MSTPNSVRRRKAPVSGTMSRSPSAQLKASCTMDALQLYMWMASPCFAQGSPAPAMVASPATKVTAAGGVGFAEEDEDEEEENAESPATEDAGAAL